MAAMLHLAAALRAGPYFNTSYRIYPGFVFRAEKETIKIAGMNEPRRKADQGGVFSGVAVIDPEFEAFTHYLLYHYS